MTTNGPETSDGDSETTESPQCTNNSQCEFYQECIDGECVGEHVCCTNSESIRPRGVELMLVLDKSGSMVNPSKSWDHDGDDADDDGFVDNDPMQAATPRRSRWSSLHIAVTGFATLYDRHFNLGATLFPSLEAQAVLGPEACLVSEAPEVPVDEMHAEMLLATIPQGTADNLKGGTPTSTALGVAYAHVDPSNAVVVLVTDGSPVCRQDAESDMELLDYDEAAIGIVADAWNQLGVPTYVVGLDIRDEWDDLDLNPHVQLDALAEVGGVANPEGDVAYYGASTEAELVGFLEVTVGRELACTIPGYPAFSDELNPTISLGQMPVQRLDPDECDVQSGWTQTDDSLKFCGDACTSFVDVGLAELQFCSSGGIRPC
ncbi:MAG: hypothetical protein ACPG4T_20940 [Nannocystaceae bacterium]